MNQRTLNRIKASVRNALTAKDGSRIIYRCVGGKFQKVQEPQLPERPNFVILSHHGALDWSGFRTLTECLAQQMNVTYPDGYYLIVERF